MDLIYTAMTLAIFGGMIALCAGVSTMDSKRRESER